MATAVDTKTVPLLQPADVPDAAIYYSEPVCLKSFLSNFASSFDTIRNVDVIGIAEEESKSGNKNNDLADLSMASSPSGDITDDSIDRNRSARQLFSGDGFSWRKSIPEAVVEEVKGLCSTTGLHVQSNSQPTIRLPDVVANSLPPHALNPSAETSTLRSVLLFREELHRRAAEIGNKKSNEDADDATENPPMKSEEDQPLPSGPHFHPQSAIGERITKPEIVVTIRVYRQYLKQSLVRTSIIGEYLLLGCLTLDVLRDAVICESDYSSLAGDLSNRPSQIAEGLPIARDRYPSGYFLINDTFHDDMRHPRAKRLSQSVLDNTPPDGYTFTRGTDMTQTRIGDLTVRIGYPYLYVHQGNCEHLVVFSDVRMFNSTTDCALVSCYPVLVHRQRQFRRPCMCCWRMTAKWAVSNCLLTPEDPTMLCESCTDRLLYDERGNKIVDAGPFKLFALPSVRLGIPRPPVVKRESKPRRKYRKRGDKNGDGIKKQAEASTSVDVKSSNLDLATTNTDDLASDFDDEYDDDLDDSDSGESDDSEENGSAKSGGDSVDDEVKKVD